MAGDLVDENDEFFTVALVPLEGAGLVPPSAAIITIQDDDAPPAVSLAAAEFTVQESAGVAVITATLTTVSALTVTVDYGVSDGTATSEDYGPVSGTLTFAPGQVQQVFSFAVFDDTAVEGPETVWLGLNNPINATPGTPVAGTLTIVDDDRWRVFIPMVRR